MKLLRSLLMAFLSIVAVSAAARAQSTGGIAGVAKDPSGAVLPGVTVEAASPALIEKVRTVVTDDSGNYKITELRPGTYTVTFTLAGFSALKREGVELTAGFTATVNAELGLGSVAETITVSGASPVVDVQNVRAQNVLSHTVLESLPTGKTLQGFAALTLGATTGANADVGGNKGEALVAITAFGSLSNDQKLLFDGMMFNYAANQGGGNSKNYAVNQLASQEVVLGMRGMGADTETGGVQVNIVPRDGGNAFGGQGVLNGTKGSLQSNNLSDEQTSRGLLTAPKVKQIYDLGGSFGGPLKHDKLWFFTAHRIWNAQEYQPNVYFNATQGVYLGDPTSGVSAYTADLSRPAFTDVPQRDHTIRLTWQAAAKHKFTVHESLQFNCQCYQLLAYPRMPEANTLNYYTGLNLLQGTWSSPVTSKLLFEAGVSALHNPTDWQRPPNVTENDIAITEQTTGLLYNSIALQLGRGQFGKADASQTNGRASVAYVTGSHAFKAGMAFMRGLANFDVYINRGLSYTFRNGSPLSLTQWDSPHTAESHSLNLAMFVQDQWTVNHFTLNGGLRLDTLHGSAPEQHLPATRFAPARDFAAISDIPNWKDLSPRVGLAYDLFGDGKTALKISFGRYIVGDSTSMTNNNNPANATVTNATRTWTDTNRNFIPDCNLTLTTANGECLATNNTNIGTVNFTNQYSPSVLKGFGVRPFQRQVTAGVQQQLFSRVGVEMNYYRTSYENYSATVNRAVTAASFDPFCVTVQSNALFPGGGGNQQCGFYDVKVASFGRVDNLITQASDFGDQSQVYDGIAISLSARLAGSGLLQGGVSTGRTVTDTCYLNDRPDVTPEGAVAANPRIAGFCRNVNPFKGSTQVKFSGMYPLPGRLQASFTFQNLAGATFSANRSYNSTEIVSSLGRPLSSGATSARTLAMIQPFTFFEPRWTQLDLRLTKVLSIGHTQLRGMFDIYNAMNQSATLQENSTFGATWRLPQSTLGGRLFKFGMQVDY